MLLLRDSPQDPAGPVRRCSCRPEPASLIAPRGVRAKGKFPFPRLPVEFSGELQAAGGVRRGDGSEVGVTQVGIRLEEVRAVKGIEQFEAELEALCFRELPPFLQAHISVHEAWRAKIRQEPWCVAKCEWRWFSKRCRIDPVVDGLILRYRADSLLQIRALVESEAAGVVRRRVDGNRQSAMCGHDSAPFPTAENRVHWTAPAVAVVLAGAEG